MHKQQFEGRARRRKTPLRNIYIKRTRETETTEGTESGRYDTQRKQAWSTVSAAKVMGKHFKRVR